MAEKNERLFDQFPEVSYQEWRAKVEADLKGADWSGELTKASTYNPYTGLKTSLTSRLPALFPDSSPMYAAPVLTTIGFRVRILLPIVPKRQIRLHSMY